MPCIDASAEVCGCRYKSNLESLNLFVMVEATKDTVVYPFESEQFGACTSCHPVGGIAAPHSRSCAVVVVVCVELSFICRWL